MAQGSYLLIGVIIINILITVRMRERNLDLSEYVHKGCTVRCKNLMGHHDQFWSSSWFPNILGELVMVFRTCKFYSLDDYDDDDDGEDLRALSLVVCRLSIPRKSFISSSSDL